jgi:hypothetical protein
VKWELVKRPGLTLVFHLEKSLKAFTQESNQAKLDSVNRNHRLGNRKAGRKTSQESAVALSQYEQG